MAVELVTPPVAYPVTLEEAKAWCRVTGDAEDAVITGAIAASTAWVEGWCGISLMARTWRLWLDRFSDAIELPKGPVTTVTKVLYVDAEGDTQELDHAAYALDLVSNPQWVVRMSDASWPATIDAVNTIAVDFVAGYQALPARFADVKTAILMLVAYWFANREAGDAVPDGVRALVNPYRRIVL